MELRSKFFSLIDFKSDDSITTKMMVTLDQAIESFDWDINFSSFLEYCVKVLTDNFTIRHFFIGPSYIIIWPQDYVAPRKWWGDHKLSKLSSHQSGFKKIRWTFNNGMNNQPYRIRSMDYDHPDWDSESHIVIRFN